MPAGRATAVQASRADGPLYLGLDFGTSGARAAVIDGAGRLAQTFSEGPLACMDWGMFGHKRTAERSCLRVDGQGLQRPLHTRLLLMAATQTN
jgi:hypothetical protein